MIYLMGIMTLLGFYLGPLVILYVVAGGLMALGVHFGIAIVMGIVAVAMVLKAITWK